jgi:hypothetical protein
LGGRSDQHDCFAVVGAVDEAEAFAAALRGLWGRVGDELGLDRPQARILEETEAHTH